MIHADQVIELFKPSGFLTEARQITNPAYKKDLFGRKLNELGLSGDFTNRVMHRLAATFTLEQLRAELKAEQFRFTDGMSPLDQEAAQGIWMLARSNYEVQFQPQQELSQRILFPATPSQRNGIEDARFVCFRNEDGSQTYYATFTAFDGQVVMPELLETNDFLLFKFITLNGPAAKNKGMAIFPRKINGRFAMLSRQDNESIYLMFSDNVHFWNQNTLLLKPQFPWELIQVGNCGSPIETDAGWLVLSHGVGPMRKYCIGAFLLDREDPSKVIGRLRKPLLSPNQNEREGYVPNVVYTCGALVHNGDLIILYSGPCHRFRNGAAGRRSCGDGTRAMKGRIAVLSPVAWRTPPRQYGAWETVASNIAEGLVNNGWDVTLFATKDSITSAKLHAVIDRGYEEDRSIDPKVAECLHIAEAFEHAGEFDLIHSHYDFMALAYSRLVKTPVLTTIHGFSSPQIMPVYDKYRDGNFVSISNSDRAPGLNYLATVYNGIDLSLYPLQDRGGEALVFLGRIHPDKGVHLAIDVALRSGLPLLIAGIVQDQAYFRERVEPHLNDFIQYIGPVDVAGKNELFAKARVLLHLNTIPERFGLVLAEANAAGVPVIAMDLGSCREVIEDGKTGFLVNTVDDAVLALQRTSEIDRQACRTRVERLFSIATMVDGYERVYREILR